MTNKNFRVEILTALNAIDIENQINSFIYHKEDTITIIDVNLNHQIFEDRAEIKCLYVAMIKYYKK